MGDVFRHGPGVCTRRSPCLPRPTWSASGAITTWGCATSPRRKCARRYAGPVLDFMQKLQPQLELAGCLFTHGLPHWDATDPLVYYLGQSRRRRRGVPAASRSWTTLPASSAISIAGWRRRPRDFSPGTARRRFVCSRGSVTSWLSPPFAMAGVAVLDTDKHNLDPFRLLTR